MVVRVQSEPFDVGHEVSSFTANQTNMGAIVTFTGIVRDIAGGMDMMEIEHYPGMTERALETIAAEAHARWSLGEVLIIHRYGQMVPQDQIMMVATSSRHRKDAFESADFLMDYLKSRAPFWKKEHTSQDAQWVVAKEEDEAALQRWSP